MIGIIGSETTKNYGLFNDLIDDPEYKVVYADKPTYIKTIPIRALRKLGLRYGNTDQRAQPWQDNMLRDIIAFEKLLVIDTALRRFDLRFLEDCKIKNPELKIYCLLLNSTSSITFSNYTIKSKFNSFPWDSVLTFDPIDARENNWRYIGLNYYSKHQMLGMEKIEKDIFFAGSMVGSRGDKIIEILKYLSENSISCEFMCPRTSKSQRSQDFPDGINLLRKRVSYSEILQKMLKSNCILEILQPGQGGGTLRYFEAVCYNKKLLTTNQRIKEYPFYNEKYMKIFSDFSDIDLNWIRKVEPIDYGYVDEFSPKYLKLDE